MKMKQMQMLKKKQQVTRTIGDKSYTYQPNWWKNVVVVSE